MNAYAMNGELIKGTGMILHRHGNRMTTRDLAKKLKLRYGNNPMKLVVAGRSHRDSQGGTVANGIAYQIVIDYNSGRTQSRLPGWQPF